MSILYIIATPIGNLEDTSKRAISILSEVDLILCEDTRKTRNLLKHFNITTPVLSYHHHSKIKRTKEILEKLKEGKNLALVSDAGTPGVSDPGNKLVAEINNSGEKIKIIPIPGPSALTAIASVAGISMDKFLFLGFPPSKKKRKKFFEQIKDSLYPVIIYESPYRIIKTLEEIKELVGNSQAVVGREITKKFETFYRGEIEEVIDKIKKDKQKGEFTVLISR